MNEHLNSFYQKAAGEEEKHYFSILHLLPYPDIVINDKQFFIQC